MTSTMGIGMTMETYLNAAIKDVITEFPEVGTILAEYDVGCVTCQVGTCLLKDVVGIHGLAPEAEQALMARIAEAVAGGTRPPGAETAVVRPAGGLGAEKRGFKYSPPLKQLVDEHVLIKRLVALIPRLLEVVDANAAEDRGLLTNGVDFIRSYADKFHHAKEEDILFGYFDGSLEIIQAMLTDHESARAHVRQLVEAVETRDGDAIADHLGAYGRLLSAHIEKEDEILYPWMDRELTTAEVGELFARFAAVDEVAGAGFTDRYTGVVAGMERSVEFRDVPQREATPQKEEARR
jgi:hemerythrin-like domain-containing protein